MSPRLSILAVIAHHGSKNRHHLDTMLASFREMDHDVTPIVVAEAPKDLPDDVEVRVGLPTEDPWSLPFAHRTVMAEHRHDFDVFIYAEDDTLVEQRHVDTHLELSRILPDDLVTGVQRYELRPDGRRSYCTIHSHYHWLPDSVQVHDGRTFARLTNDHGAATILTRPQLHRALETGGFLVPPHHGEYDMLVSAATDVYTRCGMQKVFSLDDLEGQLVHHLPNVYLDKFGIDQDAFDAQVSALRGIASGDVPSSRLFDPRTAMAERRWDRHSFPVPNPDIVGLVGPDAQRVLSIGTASGAPEAELVRAGLEVVAVPVDAVVGSVAELAGIKTTPPFLSADVLDDVGEVDLVLLLDVVGRLDDPTTALSLLQRVLRAGGEVVATVPDHQRYAWRNRLRRPDQRVSVPTSRARDGIVPTSAGWIRGQLAAAGYDQVHVTRRHASGRDPVGRGGRRAAALGNAVVARAERGADS